MFKKGQSLGLTGKVVPIMQRPFTNKWLYWDNDLNERPSKYRDIYKYMGKILYMQGAGSKKDFSALITDQLPSLQLNYNGKGFPEYISKDNLNLIAVETVIKLVRINTKRIFCKK